MVLAPRRPAIPRRASHELKSSSISFSCPYLKKDVSRRTQQVSYQVEIDMGSLSQAAIQDASPEGLQVGLIGDSHPKSGVHRAGCRNEPRREEPGTNTCSWYKDEPHPASIPGGGQGQRLIYWQVAQCWGGARPTGPRLPWVRVQTPRGIILQAWWPCSN